MFFKQFIYVDAKQKVTERSLLVTDIGPEKTRGYDVSELSDTEIGEFAARFNELKAKFDLEVQALADEFDIKYNYRQFFNDKMDIFSEEVL